MARGADRGAGDGEALSAAIGVRSPMLPRLAALILAALLALPVVTADPMDIPPPTLPTVICIYVDPGPPPIIIERECDKAAVGFKVNGTAAAFSLLCVTVRTDPPNASVGECGPAP